MATLAAVRMVGFHTLADRYNTFYTFFILWLTGAMDSIKSAKLLSKSIEKYKKKEKSIESLRHSIKSIKSKIQEKVKEPNELI